MEWAERTFGWIGSVEEISKEQLEDNTLEEYRARAVERDRSGLWVIEEEVLYRVRRRREEREDVQLVVP